MSPSIKRLLVAVVAAAIITASVFVPDDVASNALLGIGSGLMGAGMVRRPGDTAPIVILLAILATGCRGYKDIDWPQTVACATFPAADLLEGVSKVLVEDGTEDDFEISENAKDRLTELAQRHGANAVVCAVTEVYRKLSFRSSSTPTERAAGARARDFLDQLGVTPP